MPPQYSYEYCAGSRFVELRVVPLLFEVVPPQYSAHRSTNITRFKYIVRRPTHLASLRDPTHFYHTLDGQRTIVSHRIRHNFNFQKQSDHNMPVISCQCLSTTCHNMPVPINNMSQHASAYQQDVAMDGMADDVMAHFFHRQRVEGTDTYTWS